MAVDIDWIAKLRAEPSEACPEDGELQAFVTKPEDVSPSSFSHIVRGCESCRTKLQEIVLHPHVEALRRYLQDPFDLPEEVLLHCMTCKRCQARARALLEEKP